MTWRLVVERKIATALADADLPAGKTQPAACRRITVISKRRSIDGMQRVGCPGMFEIGEDQLLMLLLMVDPQRHRCRHGFPVRVKRLHKFDDLLIDITAVAINLRH